jgi:integrase
MAPKVLRQVADLYIQGGFWKLRWRRHNPDAHGAVERHPCNPVWIGPATGPERLTKLQAERIARDNFLSRTGPVTPMPESAITIEEFVRDCFVPEHVASKMLSGRTHYHAMLKHVLPPETVDRIFHGDTTMPRKILKAVPDWPYLGGIQLRDARPDDVQRLTSAALARGYSTQTAKHIRSVVSAIFEHARKKFLFTGDNPARLVTLPGMNRQEAHALTLAQTREVLWTMQYPEKEMLLMILLTGMNVAEICGLQWKFVNLTDGWGDADSERIAPLTIAVRNQWFRTELAPVSKKSRIRNLSIPNPLVQTLLALSRRSDFTGPDDFVLVNRAGGPIREHHIAARKLKPIGEKLHVPWLSWHVFHRTHTTLAHDLGVLRVQNFIAEDHGSERPGAVRQFTAEG